jgi:hypothetical protein
MNTRNNYSEYEHAATRTAAPTSATKQSLTTKISTPTASTNNNEQQQQQQQE